MLKRRANHKPSSILALYVHHMGVLLLAAFLTLIGFLVLIKIQMGPFFYSDLYEHINTSFRTQETSISLALLQNDRNKANALVRDSSFISEASSKEILLIKDPTTADQLSACGGEKQFFAWGRVCKTEENITVFLPIDSADQVLGYLKVQMPASLYQWIPFQRILHGIYLALIALFILAGALAFLFYRSTAAPIQRAMARISKAQSASDFEPILEDLPSKELSEVTSLLANRSSELADAQHKAKLGELAAQVAHDLKTPLLALKKVSTADIIFQNAITRIEDISTGLLQNFRESIRPAPRMCPANLTDLIKECIAEVDLAIAADKKIDIRLIIPNDAASTKAIIDSAEFKRAFTNILMNAVDALESVKKPEIRVEIESNIDFVRIRTTDNGRGMSQEIAASVKSIGGSFNKRDGHGLGLKLVRDFIRYYEGKLNIESKVGQGTSVILTIPTLESRERESKPDLVLIDDDPLVHQVWRADAAEKGLKLLSIFEPSKIFDAELDKATPIFVDKNLGLGIDGVELARALKRSFTFVYISTSETNLKESLDQIPILSKEFPSTYIQKETGVA